MRIALTFFLGIFLVGCATPPTETSNRITSDLQGECHTRFLKGVFGDGWGQNGYQYFAGMRRAFAIGKTTDGRQFCGHIGGGWARYSESEIVSHAINICNQGMPNRSGCVLYALGNEIVYDRVAHERIVDEARRQEVARQNEWARQREAERQRQQAADAERDRLAAQRRLEEGARAAEARRLNEEREAASRLSAQRQQALRDQARLAAEQRARSQCAGLGFQPSTERYKKCVDQLLQ